VASAHRLAASTLRSQSTRKTRANQHSRHGPSGNQGRRVQPRNTMVAPSPSLLSILIAHYGILFVTNPPQRGRTGSVLPSGLPTRVNDMPGTLRLLAGPVRRSQQTATANRSRISGHSANAPHPSPRCLVQQMRPGHNRSAAVCLRLPQQVQQCSGHYVVDAAGGEGGQPGLGGERSGDQVYEKAASPFRLGNLRERVSDRIAVRQGEADELQPELVWPI